MVSIANLNGRRKAAGLPLIRFNLRRLQAEDIQDLRDAYSAMYEISETAPGDRRGYWALARGHGYDEDLCHNDSRVFLTWHRAYAYMFEKALNSALQWKRGDSSLQLTLPFWDWTTFDAATDATNGIPRLLDDPTYTDASGVSRPNPLYSARSMYRIVSQNLQGAQQFTSRYPGRFRAEIPNLAADVARYLDNPEFARFSNDFNSGAHGAIHVRVGGADPASPLPRQTGDMTQVVSAAYDPIFWLHHAMVDKIWFDWQTAHGNSTVPQHVVDTVVYGGLTGGDVIDAEGTLLYIYSDQEVETAVEDGGTVEEDAASVDETKATVDAAAAAPPAGAPAPVTSVRVEIGDVMGPFKRAQLDFHQLHPPKGSYELRAFLNNPSAGEATETSDPSYAGRLMLFGHGDCHGAKGHCNPTLETRDVYDLRPKHPLRFQKTRYIMDVTRALRRLVGATSTPVPVDVTLVTLGADGKAVASSCIKYRGVTLATYR